jgi:hypothetical protein
MRKDSSKLVAHYVDQQESLVACQSAFEEGVVAAMGGDPVLNVIKCRSFKTMFSTLQLLFRTINIHPGAGDPSPNLLQTLLQKS